MSNCLQSRSMVRRAAAQPVPRTTTRSFSVDRGIAANVLERTETALVAFRAAKFETKAACHRLSSGNCETEHGLFSRTLKLLCNILSACIASMPFLGGPTGEALQSSMCSRSATMQCLVMCMPCHHVIELETLAVVSSFIVCLMLRFAPAACNPVSCCAHSQK